MCINDHAYRCFPGSFLKEFAARKQSEPRAYIDSLAHENVVAFRMGCVRPRGQGGCFQAINTVVGVLFPGRTLQSGCDLRGQQGPRYVGPHGLW